MHRWSLVMVVLGLAAVGAAAALGAAEAKAPAKAPAKAEKPKPAVEPDDGIQGEYAGTFTPAGGAAAKAEAKVIGEGGGAFRVVLTSGEAVQVELKGAAEGKRVALAGKAGDVEWKGACEGGQTLAAESSAGRFDLKWTVRRSPTEGAKPPAGAVVLLPYEPGRKTSLDEWANPNWELLDDGSARVMKGNNVTKREFRSVRLHVEFLCPYMPAARGQGRANSGVYLHGKYETQVLDSFGLPVKDNECGGIYSVAAPKTNASLPPGRWQTYDITFRAPAVDADGKITRQATLSVAWNGVPVHEDQAVSKITTAGMGGPIKATGPLMLQDHGNPVQYRNIWYVELKE